MYRVLLLLEKVPYVEIERHVGYDSAWHDDMGAWSNPVYDLDPQWQALRLHGLDSVDAHHVMLALRGRCEIFLTLDVKTILCRREAIEAEFPIRLMKPSEFVAHINTAA
jgi:hypothetical protein